MTFKRFTISCATRPYGSVRIFPMTGRKLDPPTKGVWCIDILPIDWPKTLDINLPEKVATVTRSFAQLNHPSKMTELSEKSRATTYSRRTSSNLNSTTFPNCGGCCWNRGRPRPKKATVQQHGDRWADGAKTTIPVVWQKETVATYSRNWTVWRRPFCRLAEHNATIGWKDVMRPRDRFRLPINSNSRSL